mmetsp:Transcript_47034/g.100407  ORF Transcript_47034/g.100407 Transcript_47034/m.100407 type:complete len:115 (-) Transcript_47034:492-836(-)
MLQSMFILLGTPATLSAATKAAAASAPAAIAGNQGRCRHFQVASASTSAAAFASASASASATVMSQAAESTPLAAHSSTFITTFRSTTSALATTASADGSGLSGSQTCTQPIIG